MGSGGTYTLLPPGKLFDEKEALTHRIQEVVYALSGIYLITKMLIQHIQTTWVLYGQASRAISTG